MLFWFEKQKRDLAEIAIISLLVMPAYMNRFHTEFLDSVRLPKLRLPKIKLPSLKWPDFDLFKLPAPVKQPVTIVPDTDIERIIKAAAEKHNPITGS